MENLVDWQDIRGKVTGVKTFDVDFEKVLDGFDSNRSTLSTVDIDGDHRVDVDMSILLKPLGDYWKLLFSEGEMGLLKDTFRKYCQYKGKPLVSVDFLVTTKDEYPIRTHISRTKEDKKNYIQLNRLIDDVDESMDYDRTVIGTDGNNVEFQFLNTRHRKEARPGELVDCGVFVSVNGSVKVSPGVHQLICSNGVTEKFHLWKSRDYKFGNSMVTRAVALSEWLISQNERKVESIRELGVILDDGNFKSIARMFWKVWSEKIDLRELTFYDVISDVTRAVGNTLKGKRYNAIAIPSNVFKYDKEKRCPTCSAKVCGHA